MTRHQKHPAQAPALRRDPGTGCPGPHSDRTRRTGRARPMDRHRHTERRAGYCRDRSPPHGIGRRYRLTRTSKTTQRNSPGALSQTPTTSAIPIASLMAGHHPAPIRHGHPRTATPRATCLDYNAFAMAEAAPDVAGPAAARCCDPTRGTQHFPRRGHDVRAHNTAAMTPPRHRRAAPITRRLIKSAARERVDNDPGGLTGRDNVKITREIQLASHSRGGRLGTALDRPAFDDIPTADQVDLV